MANMHTIEVRPLGTRCCDEVTETQISADEAKELTDGFQILGHPIRLQLLDILARHGGQVCVCDLESAVPVKQPTVSHHLRLLREAGVIDCERHGQWVYYFVKREKLAALRAQTTALFDQWV